jgi:hypothetical protein
MNLGKFAQATAFSIFTLIPVVAVAELAARDTITRAFSEAIPEIPGKSINAIVVTYQPGGKSPPHHPCALRVCHRLRVVRLDSQPGEWQ